MTTMNTATDTVVDKDSILPLPMAWMIKPDLMVVDLMLSPAVTRLYACHMSSGSSGMRTTCLQEGSHHCEDEHLHPLHPLTLRLSTTQSCSARDKEHEARSTGSMCS